jgi:2-dehydropantoate 2-reductase
MKTVIVGAGAMGSMFGGLLHEAGEEVYLLAICERTAANLNSVYQDILAKRQTEVDYINGALVREGEALGVEVALNRTIMVLIKGLEATASVRAD